MKRILIYIAIVAVLAVSCTKGKLPELDMPSGYTPSDSPISFKTEDNWGDDSDKPMSKGLICTSDTFLNFTTFAYYLPSTDGAVAEWSDDLTPNFMYNQMVKREKLNSTTFTDWSYTPMKYWSDKPNDRFRFFACAPYSCYGVELSNNTDKGAPRFTVAPHHRPYYHQDFMTAQSLIKCKSDSEVNFKFKHKLAQAKIYVAHKGNVNDSVKILGITVSGLRKRGYLSFDELTNEYQWEHLQPENNDTATSTTSYNFWAAREHPNELRDSAANIKQLDAISTNISDYTDPSIVGGKAYMFLVPQNNIKEIKFILFFDYYDSVKKRRVQSFQKFLLHDSSLKEGESMVYLLLIDPVSVGYGEVITTAEPWSEKEVTDGGSGNDWIIE